jgi:hypothetical protein
MFLFLKSPTLYSQEKFNSFTTNFHLIIFQLILSSIQFNLNPIVELNLVALEFNSIQILINVFKYNSIQDACNGHGVWYK